MEQLIIPGTDDYIPLTDVELINKHFVLEGELKDLRDTHEYAERHKRPTAPLVKAFALIYNQQTQLLQAIEQRGLSSPELIERSYRWQEY